MAPRKNLVNRKVPYKPRGPHPSKGQIRGPEPHRWFSGPDERRHNQYVAWLRAKAQANFRKEGWTMTFEEFEFMWNQDASWEQRGRGSDDLLMTRRDSSKPWSSDNCYIMLRGEHLRIHAQAQAGKPKKTLKQGRRQNGK